MKETCGAEFITFEKRRQTVLTHLATHQMLKSREISVEGAKTLARDNIVNINGESWTISLASNKWFWFNPIDSCWVESQPPKTLIENMDEIEFEPIC